MKKICLLNIMYEIDTNNDSKILLAKSITVKTLIFSLVSFHPIEPFMNVHTYREKNFILCHPISICRIHMTYILHKQVYLHIYYSAYIFIY